MAISQESSAPPDIGLQANNSMLIDSLSRAVAAAQGARRMIPALVAEVIEDEAWRFRRDANGRQFVYGPDEFEKFITDPYPSGLQASVDELRFFMPDGSPERIAFDRLLDSEAAASLAQMPPPEPGEFER